MEKHKLFEDYLIKVLENVPKGCTLLLQKGSTKAKATVVEKGTGLSKPAWGPHVLLALTVEPVAGSQGHGLFIHIQWGPQQLRGLDELVLYKPLAFSKHPVNVNYHYWFFICLWFCFMVYCCQLMLHRHLK